LTYSSVAALAGVPTACISYGEFCGLNGSSDIGISGAGGLSVTLKQQQPTMIIPSYITIKQHPKEPWQSISK